MLYRDLERRVDARDWLRRNRSALLHPSPLAAHDEVVRLLVEYGEIESAATDRLLPECDAPLPQTRALRRLALRTGQLLHTSWHALPPPNESLDGDWRLVEESVAALENPLRVKVPEGFAIYGLYPETYLEAAERFARTTRPGAVVCIGLRTIGAPLSAVVAAALEAVGRPVTLLTLRPRGQPFARAPVLSPEMDRLLCAHAAAHALIIDEGPGLSGSSFAGVAQALVQRGFAAERIIFFPSWTPAADRLRSASAQHRWPLHAKWLGDFDATWITSGRLSSLPLKPQDAGRWRERLFAPADFPPAQTQHERRKYLTLEQAPRLFKFAGLGPYGTAAWRRAALLADAGFTPPVHAVRHGFLVQPFVDGRPLTPHDAGPALIERVAGYLAFLQRTFPAPAGTPGADLQRMIVWHVRDALGLEFRETAAFERLLEPSPPVQLDGRMQPWEWLATPSGFLKTDAIDHHADHFYPGAADIAWDLAGFSLEFALDGGATELLLRRFIRHGGDRCSASRLPLFRVAYAAFCTGYARLAQQTMAGTAEAPRFHRREAHFTAKLRHALQALPAP